MPPPNEYQSADRPNVKGVDSATGQINRTETSSVRSSDYPNLEYPDPAIAAPGGERNLTDAEISAGIVGTQPGFQSSATITLSGGGQPGSIFAATIDGVQFAEQIYNATPRYTAEAAIDIAQSLRAKFPYLKAEASGSTVNVQSLKPSLSITAAASPIPLSAVTIYQGTQMAKLGDRAVFNLNGRTATVSFDGTEQEPDFVLMRIYDVLSRKPLANLYRIETYFVASYIDSYVYLAPWTPFTQATVTNFGQIQVRMGPMTAGAGDFQFTVS